MMVMMVVMLTVMNVGKMSYIHSLMLFFVPTGPTGGPGAWTTIRITRDGVFTQAFRQGENALQKGAFTHRRVYTQKFFFTQRSVYTEDFTWRSLYTE